MRNVYVAVQSSPNILSSVFHSENDGHSNKRENTFAPKMSPRTMLITIIWTCLIVFSMAFWIYRNMEVFPEQLWLKHDQWWSMDLSVLIEPANICETSKVLVCVTSSPKNFEKRQGIRETWATTNNLSVIFLLGVPQGPEANDLQTQIHNESKIFKDILQMNFNEHYRNLTMKSVALVSWTVQTRWPKRQLVIKADDDTFINTKLLFAHLNQFQNGKIFGSYRKATKVLRCEGQNCGKWGLTRKEYSPDVFLPHLQGSFYILTETALESMSKHLFSSRYIFIEDVYLTGLVAERAGVQRSPMPNHLEIDPFPPGNKSLTRLKGNLVAQHYCAPSHQREYWQQLERIEYNINRSM